MAILSAPYFHNEEKAYQYIESLLWPHGPVCPHCGNKQRIIKLHGKTTRQGLYKCLAKGCHKPFTVKIDTIFESSHIPLHIWLQAFYLMCSSKKGISANQLHRTLEITLKTAWFLSHRIRKALEDETIENFGKNGQIVEIDEAYLGKTKGYGKGPHLSKKRKIIAIFDRRHQWIKSMVMEKINSDTVRQLMERYLSPNAHLMTDQAPLYKKGAKYYKEHSTVNHSLNEYTHPNNPQLNINTVENYFALFKRGMKGIYQHCKKKHLSRYLAEFDHRYNYRSRKQFTDIQRMEKAICASSHKRLTYQNLKE